MFPMAYQDKIMQWNLNGLQRRLPRLQTIVNDMQPKILALQEIKQSETQVLNFRGYKVYKKCRPIAGGGGVCLLVPLNIPSSRIQLNTDLEAVACKF